MYSFGPVTIFGLCPDGCLVQNCKIYINLVDFDHGLCSCDRLNSNNLTVTFCSEFLKEVNKVSPKALTSVEILFQLSLWLMGLSFILLSYFVHHIPDYYRNSPEAVDQFIEDLLHEARNKKKDATLELHIV